MLMILSCITLTEFIMGRCFTSMRTSFKLKTSLMFFYAENHRGLTSEEHTRFLSRVNAMRDLQNEPLIDLVTLRDALSIWTLCNTEITQSKTIHGFMDGFFLRKSIANRRLRSGFLSLMMCGSKVVTI